MERNGRHGVRTLFVVAVVLDLKDCVSNKYFPALRCCPTLCKHTQTQTHIYICTDMQIPFPHTKMQSIHSMVHHAHASRRCISHAHGHDVHTPHTTHAHARTRTNILSMHHPRKAIGTFVSRDTRYKPFGSLSSSIPTPQAWRSLLVCLSA